MLDAEGTLGVRVGQLTLETKWDRPSFQPSPDPRGGSGLSKGLVPNSAAAQLRALGPPIWLSGNQPPAHGLVCRQGHHSAVSLGALCF